MQESTFARERIVDKIAREMGLDKYELRRKMMYRDGDFPYKTPTGAIIESGSELAAFDRAIELGERALQKWAAHYADQPSIRVGMGVATYVEGTTPTYFGTTGHWTSQDSCDVRFDPDGSVTASVGITAIGQGAATMVATVVAEELGVPVESVRVVEGDTDAAPYGLGSWGSRGATVGAGSLLRATSVLREKGFDIASHLLEASPADLEVRDGMFFVRGSADRSVTWAQVAQSALVRTLDLPEGMEPGLEARATFAPAGLQHVPDENGQINACASYSNATHVAIVAVDIDTGHVSVPHFVVVHDCGTVLNPQIVDGQIQGGIAQGIGGALLENNSYDENAQPQATTFVEYLMPTAVEVPPIEIEHFESPAPDMPYGAKGVGEAGVIGVPQAVAQGIEHALAEFDIDEITETPITPAKVRAAIVAARERSAR